jgi:hypothetical protein
MFFLTMTGHATVHVFVQTSEGVWLASDSLIVHNGEKVNHCKVVISRSRLIFNTGDFRDSTLLRSEESTLPFADIKATIAAMVPLFSTNHMHSPGQYSPLLADVAGGVVQVHDSVFQEQMFQQNVDLATFQIPVNIMIGIPRGFGDAVNEANVAARKDSVYAARIASHPKEELLKIVADEATRRPSEVGPPFSVLLLHNDGTVSDYSDERFCTIPADAAHVEHADPEHVTSK